MQVDSDDEFRMNVTTLYLKNKLSAKDTCNVIRSAAKSGASGVDDMKKTVKKAPQNAARDLNKKIMKNVDYPESYYADVPVRDRKTGKRAMVSYPFMLVHEVLFHLVLAFGNTILQHIDFAPNSGFAKMKNDFSRTYNLPDEPLIPIGIHGDGVELHKRMSMEVISWNVCSWDGSKRHIFTCVEKQDVRDCGCGGRCTLDAIL